MGAACKSPGGFSPFQLILYEVEQLRLDNSGMAVFHIILRHLAFVGLLLFSEEIHRKFLLQTRVAFVLFIRQNCFQLPRPATQLYRWVSVCPRR